MRRTLARLAEQSVKHDGRPIIRIANGTFYRQHPSATPPHQDGDAPKGQDDAGEANNPPLFPGLNFVLPAFSSPVEKWSVLSKSSAARTTFLQILKGQHICLPPTARSYPYLLSDEIAAKDHRLRSAHNAVQYVGFDAERGQSGGNGMRGAYLSARYESLREETDFSLLDFLMGNTELNPDERLARHPDPPLLERVMRDLRLIELAEMPVTHLSNGQTRRAKIAKALLSKPEVLLLDGPFMGLDPPTLKHLSGILSELAEAQAPRLVLSLKPDEHIPHWITHMAYVTQKFQMGMAGPRNDVITHIHERWDELKKVERLARSQELTEELTEYAEVSRHLWAHTPAGLLFEDRRAEMAYYREFTDIKQELTKGKREEKGPAREIISRDGFTTETKTPEPGEAIIEMDGVKVQYGDKAVLGNWKQDVDGKEKDGLWWDVRRGQRWGVFGPNGSGKTTLISLITSDHPQTYSLPIKLFGRTRLPQPGQPGISIFDLQQRIGHSSPEVHVFFPKHLSLRRTIESAWADTPLTKPKLTYDIDEKVNAALSWFRGELEPSLGPTKWMKREMDRAIVGVDAGPFDRTKQSSNTSVAARHLRLSEKAIVDEQQEMEGDDWADRIKFGELTFSAQRVALFIRAIIRNPDLVVLDEAFSGMDDFARDKCQLFLSHGEDATFHLKRNNGNPINWPKITRSDLSRLGMSRIKGLQKSQALIVVSHKKEEVPGCVRNWICLPENGQGAPRFGQLDAPLELASSGWGRIWGDKVERTIEERKERLRRQIELAFRPGWPTETPEQRKARLERRDAYIKEMDIHYGAILSKVPDQGKQGVRRTRQLSKETDAELLREQKRIRARLQCAAESPEERERRLIRDRIRWAVRMERMTQEERTQYHRDRNKRYLEGRPDRAVQVKKSSRAASSRQRAKLTEEERLKRNERAKETRLRKLAAMTEEEKEEKRLARKEARMRKLADPLYAEKLKAKGRVRMMKHREKKKQTPTKETMNS